LRGLYALLFFVCPGVMAQTITIKGIVNDKARELLPSAHVILYPDSLITTTTTSGEFSLRTGAGQKQLQVSYIGYNVCRLSFVVKRDTTLTVSLSPATNELKEVVITAARSAQEAVFRSNSTSTHVLTQDDINAIPVLGGEADVIKTLQLLPGTVRGVEGSSDLFVRGGAADQNLVLLDDAPIYNTSHLFGFLSVFNPDVLDRVEAINGGFPAQYGGRLSSILNVQTTSDIPDRLHVSGDVGIIASRLYVEQPILKNKASFWIAARRTYIDQVVKAMGEELPYFFYDLNGKILLKPTANDNISFSYYNGKDILDIFRDRNNDGNGFLTTYNSGNNSQSLQWRRTFLNHWSQTLSVVRSTYKYDIKNSFEENELLAMSDIEDYGARWQVQKDSMWRNGTLKAGIDWTRHAVSPNVINSTGTIAELLESSTTTGKVANEVAAHFQYEWNQTQRWRLNAGMRFSGTRVGAANYFYPEPRFSARYSIRENQAVKFSYARMVQYLHRISNSAVSTPTDIWYPVTEDIRPQTSHQWAVAWQKSFPAHHLMFTLESYYKTMDQLIGYEEGTNLFLNTDFESKLIQGKGRAYGVEVLLRKEAGKFTGWVSYTLSWSWRQFNEINGGQWFPSRYDRRHNGAIVTQYAFHKRWAVSMVWEFISGARFTPVIGQYVIFSPTLTGVDLIPVFSGINSVKLADSHRLDVGIKFKNKAGRKFHWQWFAGVYNAYNRASPIGISIEQNEEDGSLSYEQPGLFGLIPFISYGFKF
jgi:hypothetical protein